MPAAISMVAETPRFVMLRAHIGLTRSIWATGV
jgi:hypothetical protein